MATKTPRAAKKTAADKAVESAEDAGVVEPKVTQITVDRIKRATVEVPIIGVTPLVPHRWSEKARKMMRDKQMGRAEKARSPKQPEEDAREATYWMPDGRVGMPATAFKGAIADAARYFGKSVTMEDLKRAIFVHGIVTGDGPLVAIDGDPEMFEAMPRNSSGVADLRYRNMIWPWKATLEVEFITALLTEDAIVNLVDAAGISGVGDMRPSSPKSKTGTYGKFKVDA